LAPLSKKKNHFFKKKKKVFYSKSAKATKNKKVAQPLAESGASDKAETTAGTRVARKTPPGRYDFTEIPLERPKRKRFFSKRGALWHLLFTSFKRTISPNTPTERHKRTKKACPRTLLCHI